MNNKKWYNYFVVTSPADVASETAAPAEPPRRVSDIVSPETDTAFAAPVTTQTFPRGCILQPHI